jgi:spore coat protein SA
METSLHPVPPVADSAPEWNVFRLAEAKSTLEIHVISPCEKAQLPALRGFPAEGNYHHIVLKNAQLWLYRKILRHILPLKLAVRRFFKLPDLMSWWYLRQARHILVGLSPDLVIINDRPQYIRYLRNVVPRGRLLLFMRGELGESREFLPLLDGIIVNSEGIRKYARQFVNPDKTSVWLMPNSLGEEFTIPEDPESHFRKSHKTILFAGRLIPEKGVLELLDAFEFVLKELPKTKLVICGASDVMKQRKDFTHYEMEVRRRAELLLPGSVQFQGYIPNVRIREYYVTADLAVFPSVWLESFGMVALEAMRCGIPVIASRRPGFEELVIHGQTGFLVDDPTDPAALAKAMLSILHDPELGRRMGEAGYQRSLEYRPEVAIKRFEAILEEIINKEVFIKAKLFPTLE